MSKVIYFIAITFLLIGLSCYGQTETFITDTSRINYLLPANNTDIDSVVTIKDYEKGFSDWEIYFNKSKKQLAYESIINGDTCTKIDYWRNGNLKKKTLLVKGKDNYFRWWCDIQYYQNGQLIVEWCPSQFNEKTLITRYYPNGKKQMQWTQFQIGAVGMFIWWHDNGQKESEVNYENNVEEGERKYWDKEGSLIKSEMWVNGEIVSPK
jgi:antitoxin component YwqK of YwqJK toxin-antitoxin module